MAEFRDRLALIKLLVQFGLSWEGQLEEAREEDRRTLADERGGPRVS